MRSQIFTVPLRVVALLSALCCPMGGAWAAARRPAVLFATAANPGDCAPPWLGYCEQLGCMSELRNAAAGTTDAGAAAAAPGALGFELDFLDGLNDLTSARLRQYDAVVLFFSPGSLDTLQHTAKEDVPTEAMLNATIERFVPTVSDFVQRGGGVLLFPSEQNWYTQFLPELTSLFGAVLPLETLVESNLSNTATLTHMGSSPIAYTDGVTAGHPVTEGVRGVWYPTGGQFQAANTGPIVVGSEWTVLLHGSPTTHTRAVNLSAPSTNGKPPPCAATTCKGRTGIAAPALFAVREMGKGRVALLNQWRQFTYGSGTHFYFDKQVLIAVAEIAVLLHPPPLPLAGVSMGM